jgi:hypothetical protein
MVHRFYLTKKKVYLLGGKLQRSREKNKKFGSRSPCYAGLTAVFLLLVQV